MLTFFLQRERERERERRERENNEMTNKKRHEKGNGREYTDTRREREREREREKERRETRRQTATMGYVRNQIEFGGGVQSVEVCEGVMYVLRVTKAAMVDPLPKSLPFARKHPQASLGGASVPERDIKTPGGVSSGSEDTCSLVQCMLEGCRWYVSVLVEWIAMVV